MHSFVDLSRRFRDLTASELEDPELLISLGESGFYSSVGWPELLRHPRVLLLAEAGSGKTTEMREQARRLACENEYAFFVPLESLDRDNLSDLLSADEEHAVAAWKTDGRSTAWFFLDAVDELKLNQGTLERALGRFAKAVDGLLDRTRVVIAGRPSDWRPALDMATLEAKLPVVPPEAADSASDEVFLQALRKEGGFRQQEKEAITVEGVRTVVLLPMSRRQIEVFSQSLGITDTSEFLAEIQEQNAWIFARCPLDCSDLAATWKASGRLGTRAEQHEANIAVRIKDDPERPDRGVLSNTRARLGAERLALALALTRTRTLRSPERGPEFDQADSVLDPADILPDWDEEERQTLLRRGIFDPATYGRVRFHHRSVQEYLAACRLNSLRDKGMPVKSLLRFLFAECYGVRVVIPSMRAIAAWFALWDEDVRREVTAREPETLIRHGDPESLPMAARAALIRAFAVAYGEGGWRGLNIPISEMRRLAHPELADVIREVWGSGPENEDVRELLLELIWQGEIRECADIAIGTAENGDYASDQRIMGIRALVACHCTRAATTIADSILAKPDAWSDRVVHGVAGDLFPDIINAGEFVKLVERTPEPENSAGGFSWGSREVATSVEPWSDAAVQLRDGLADLIWRGRADEQESYQIVGQYSYVAPALSILCERQLSGLTGNASHELIRASVIANRFGQDEVGSEELFAKLKSHFHERSALRGDAFWPELAVMDELVPEEDDRLRFYHAEHGSLVESLSEETDRAWLEATLADTSATRRRGVALQALIQFWIQRGRDETEVDALYKAVQDDAALTERISSLTAPAEVTPEQKEIQDRLRDRQRDHEQRDQKRLENWNKWREDLLADPAKAFSTDHVATTVGNIYKWLMAHEGNRNHYNLWNRAALVEAFGSDVADRAKSAFGSVWRTNRPALWSHRPPSKRSSTPYTWIFGLCGIAAEAASPEWVKTLTSDEARTAAAYATIELNGFPFWLADLVDAYPREADEILGTELSEELAASTEHQHLPLLQDLSHADISVKKLLAPRCLAALETWPSAFADEKTSQRSAHYLDQVFRILYDATGKEHKVAISAECNDRFKADPQGPFALPWLRGLFRFDAERGAQALEEHLAAPDQSESAHYAVRVFAALFGDRSIELLTFDEPKSRAVTLGRLVHCAYKYIRPEDDQRHDGVYTPNTRDKAEDARTFLLSVLVNSQGAEAHRIVMELADDPLFAHFPDRLRNMARERAAVDAEFPPFRAADIAQLEARLETPPHDRDGLFELMKDRLDDLAHDIAHSDFTDRATLCAVTEENQMQRTIARRLRDMARGAYLVTREEEVADRKEPDIRLVAVQGNQNAVIEVKIADNGWSIRDLESALRNQLVGQYMRHESSRAGCLLLTYGGRQQYWLHPETDAHLSFSEIIDYLDAVAKEIESANDYDLRLTIHALDLTD